MVSRSRARRSFFSAVDSMKLLAQERLLTDDLPLTSGHNFRAQLLRSGLVVSVFSQLETYLENRLAEKIVHLRHSRISYRSFDDALRKFLSISAAQGLVTRAMFLDKPDQISYAEVNLPSLAGLLRTRPSYTAHGFSPRGSNVGVEDVPQLLAAFGVKRAWGLLQALCGRIGVARLSVEDDFRNFAKARNRAAHDGAAANIATADLLTHIGTAVLVGVSVDLAVSHAIDCFVRNTTSAAATTAAGNHNFIIRFLDQQADGRWKEMLEQGRAVQYHPTKTAAVRIAAGRRAQNFLIVRDARLVPIDFI